MRLFALGLIVMLAAAGPAAARPPVVVELFTSQGCEGCAEANAYAASLAEREDVLALTFSVDYLDYLGWRDTFAKPEFADRQMAYVKRFTVRAAYAPQVVIDGRSQAAATQPDKIEKLLSDAGRAPRNPPDMMFREDGRLLIGSGPAPKGGAEVWMVRYDPHAQEVEVTKGENRGKIIAYRNVVQELVRLGAWSGKPKAYRLPPPGAEGLETAILVQQAGGGRVLALLAD